MSRIPIFDSLTHPMPNGGWLLPKYDGNNTVTKLVDLMSDNEVKWALAVGMGNNIGAYNEDTYARFIKDNSDNLFPVAYFDFNKIGKEQSIKTYLAKLKALGYVGIKIHPRFSGINASNPNLVEIIKEANQQHLAILLCTYFWSRDRNLCSYNPEQLLALLCEVPDEKVILVHGGAVRLLEVVEIARQFTNVLLDLSLTLCKWEKSSLDMDIAFVFNSFDRRVCVGSDSPEFKQDALRRRYDYFAQDISRDKAENIAFNNLALHFGLKL